MAETINLSVLQIFPPQPGWLVFTRYKAHEVERYTWEPIYTMALVEATISKVKRQMIAPLIGGLGGGLHIPGQCDPFGTEESQHGGLNRPYFLLHVSKIASFLEDKTSEIIDGYDDLLSHIDMLSSEAKGSNP